MKIEALFLLFLGVFFGMVGLVYWFSSYEDGGTMMLVGTCPARPPARAATTSSGTLRRKKSSSGARHGAGDRP